jgi:hypothetical protein
MNHEDQEEQPLSRQAYRQQQAKRGRKGPEETVDSEPDADVISDAPDEELPPISETRSHTDPSDAKTLKLKHKLNLVIIGLVIAIILVYLVLFFVG